MGQVFHPREKSNSRVTKSFVAQVETVVSAFDAFPQQVDNIQIAFVRFHNGSVIGRTIGFKHLEAFESVRLLE